MTSTSFMVGAGLKKWMPQTRPGLWTSIAISMTGSVDVLVARMASSRHTWLRSTNSSFLVVRSSTTDSITRSQSARAFRSPVAMMRPSTASRSASSIRPFSTSRFRPFSSEASVASAVCLLPRAEHHLVAGLRRHLGDARPHDPRPDDPHTRDLHRATDVTDR